MKTVTWAEFEQIVCICRGKRLPKRGTYAGQSGSEGPKDLEQPSEANDWGSQPLTTTLILVQYPRAEPTDEARPRTK